MTIPFGNLTSKAHVAAWLANHAVYRWHNNPDMAHVSESVADHVSDMLTLHLRVFGGYPEADLYAAIVFHDAHEATLGDMPAPAKVRFPALAAAYDEAAAEIDAANGWTVNLSDDDRAKLQLLDKLSAYRCVADNAPDLLARAEWLDARERIIAMAEVCNADLGGII